MKWTISSLYLLIFVTLLGFGFVLDRIYSVYFSDPVDDTGAYRIIFESVRRQANADLPLGEQSRNALPDLFVLEKSADFRLPRTLSSGFDDGAMIILDSDAGLSLHQKLTDPEWTLSFGPIPRARPDIRPVEYLLTVVFYLGVALVLVLWVRPLIRDVGLLSDAARKLGQGELETRLAVDTWFLKDLFSDFNKMASRLQALSANNQLYSQAVSHDLRTPLARIEFALEKLQQEPVSNEQQSAILKIRQDVSRIEMLTSELLEYARIGHTRQLQPERIDLHVFLHQVIAEFSTAKQTIAYQRESEAALFCSIDVSLFHKLISNLIDNATRHAASRILISLAETDDGAVIMVEDDGPGFDAVADAVADAGAVNKIFEPFVKGDGRGGNHFGLGLAVCNRVVQQHNGSIEADNSSSLGGARMIVTLPC